MGRKRGMKKKTQKPVTDSTNSIEKSNSPNPDLIQTVSNISDTASSPSLLNPSETQEQKINNPNEMNSNAHSLNPVQEITIKPCLRVSASSTISPDIQSNPFVLNPPESLAHDVEMLPDEATNGNSESLLAGDNLISDEIMFEPNVVSVPCSDVVPLSKSKKMVENHPILISTIHQNKTATQKISDAAIQDTSDAIISPKIQSNLFVLNPFESLAHDVEMLTEEATNEHSESLLASDYLISDEIMLEPNAVPILYSDVVPLSESKGMAENHPILISTIDQNKTTIKDTSGADLPIPIIIQSTSLQQSDLTQADSPVILPLDAESISILNNNSNIATEFSTPDIPDLSVSQNDLECTLQFDHSRCSHMFSGLSANISRIDQTIADNNVVEFHEVVENNNTRCKVTDDTQNSTRSVISITIDKDFLPVQSSSANTSAEPEVQCRSKGGRPKRGRKRKHPQQNRAEKKARLNKGLEYVNAKGVTIEKKKFIEGFDCNCNNKCTEKLTENERKTIFKNYWEAGTYEARCAILQGYCKEVKKKTSTNTDSTKRCFTRKYTLNGVSVCKKLFLKTLSISQKPLDIALNKVRAQQPVTDKRGKTGGHNKIPEEKVLEVVEFINRLPKYKSHYCRDKTMSTKYLASHLNISRIYDLYKERYPEGVSRSCFKKIFYTKFNLRFKKPQKDTCNKCDMFKIKKQNAVGSELQQTEAEHTVHLNNAMALREQMKSDMKKATQDDTIETLTFDLEKTNCLPRLPTNIIYYKRQLNLYNLGIHQASNNQGYFNVWLEFEGGRGTQEIGCCLKKFIENNIRNTTTELLLWADSCGGQNKSIKLVVMLMHILLNHDTLQKITMRFLQPGHTFLPNDSEFGDLECALKTHNRLYTADDYINVMKACRRKNKFIINRFSKEDFLCVDPLLKAIVNRKKDINKNKVLWQKTFEIGMKKNEPFKLFFKTDITSDTVQTVNLQRPNKSTDYFKNIELPQLYPNGRDLSSAKIKDLKEMLHLIPKDAKGFYDFLKNNTGGDFEDDIDGYGEEIDFDLLDDDAE